MRPSLAMWIGQADALRNVERLNATPLTLDYEAIRARTSDYYIGLVGELFEQLRENAPDGADWSRLGNALFDVASGDPARDYIDPNQASLFAATAFAYGGFPASAYLAIRDMPLSNDPSILACMELLVRSPNPRSAVVRDLVASLLRGDLQRIRAANDELSAQSAAALIAGPDAWIPARLLEKLVTRFRRANVRNVLPDGSSERWTPLVESLVRRTPPSWEFFPSQIEAIERGVLHRNETFVLQMPTGAGKTTLCETLLYSHAQDSPDGVAVLLVPYRSLAAELRHGLVRRLNEIGVVASSAYGGTIPTPSEVQDMANVRALVATPEALSGIVSVDSDFLRRISLVICDEGHLLDGESRGVSLELLLARLRARLDAIPKCVFVSAIVPNIGEINSWLGGAEDTVVRSDYRPALAEFAFLRQIGTGAAAKVEMSVLPHVREAGSFIITDFLPSSDFRFVNPASGRTNNYSHTSIKTQSVAAARKLLALGSVAIFSANKRGDQGAVGIAEELLSQLDANIPLARPIEFASREQIGRIADFLSADYGDDWIVRRCLLAGGVLHHGDIPQEVREVLEEMLRREEVRLAICTSTLAEGVNLPIRTLVLYSVQRRGIEGRPQDLLTRDIKNLVGRAGRPGVTTRGLVICANPAQWRQVERVANQDAGEPVRGALYALLNNLRQRLAISRQRLTNDFLESDSEVFSLTDGIDATLIDLAADELGREALIEEARRVARSTFAAWRNNGLATNLLIGVFEMRAQRIDDVRAAGRLNWIRNTGVRPRLLASVEANLFNARDWTQPIAANDAALIATFVTWAWSHPDFRADAEASFRLDANQTLDEMIPVFGVIALSWLGGQSFREMSQAINKPIDELLQVHSRLITFQFLTLVEQAIALLERLVESAGGILTEGVRRLPECLRYGTVSYAGAALAHAGLRHRRAITALGNAVDALRPNGVVDRPTAIEEAYGLIFRERDIWNKTLGEFVSARTFQDLDSLRGRRLAE